MNEEMLALNLDEYSKIMFEAYENGDTEKLQKMKDAIRETCVIVSKAIAVGRTNGIHYNAEIKSLIPFEEFAAISFVFSGYDKNLDTDTMYDLSEIFFQEKTFIPMQSVFFQSHTKDVAKIDDKKLARAFPKFDYSVKELIYLGKLIEDELEKVGFTKSMTFEIINNAAEDLFKSMKPSIAENETSKIKNIFENHDYSGLDDGMHNVLLYVIKNKLK